VEGLLLLRLLLLLKVLLPRLGCHGCGAGLEMGELWFYTPTPPHPPVFLFYYIGCESNTFYTQNLTPSSFLYCQCSY
jgi:hypothetical protein